MIALISLVGTITQQNGIVKVPRSGPIRDQCMFSEYRIPKFYAYIYLLILETLPLICCMVLLIRLVGSLTSTRLEVGMGHIQ